jgi:hypothetical protein
MRKIDKKDWGPRANIYLYRVEPVIDRTRTGNHKFIMTYAEPVNEDRIMADCGSGRYKLILNFRKPGAEQGDTVDTFYMDILNMKYPPKIPIGEWTDDPINKKWAWCKEKDNPQPVVQQQATIDPLAAFGTFMDIQDRIQERTTPPNQPTTASPATADPFDTAAKIMQMRANDPMIAALMQRLDASDKAAEAARLREFELQKELRQPVAAVQSKSLVDQILELATVADKLAPLKTLFGFANGNGAAAAGETVVRTARTTGLDVLRDFVTSPVAEKIGAGLGDLFSRMADAPPQPVTIPLTPTVANGNATPRPQPAAQGETDQQRIIRIAQTITGPMLDEFFDQDEPGDLFAEKVFDFWPADLKFLQGLGAERILNLYRGFAPAWARVGPKEQQFAQFLKEFCEWKPELEEEPASEDGIVDFAEDAKEANA